MALHPYSTYKPSGVPWLGDVPEHWDGAPPVRVERAFPAIVSNAGSDRWPDCWARLSACARPCSWPAAGEMAAVLWVLFSSLWSQRDLPEPSDA